MIIVEDRFKEMFDYLPELENDDAEYEVVFKVGDKYEMDAFLKVESLKSPYPLIWLLYPFIEKQKEKSVDLENVSIVLAVDTSSEMLSEQRLDETYKKVLIPLYENIVKLFRLSNTISANGEYDVTKFMNYSDESGDNESKVAELWDAMKVTFSCTINSNCLKTINL